jgi:hypothetical protein
MTATLDRELAAADAGVVADGKPADPDPEVPQRARRRSFTAKYKLEVLAAYDAAEPGEKGARPAHRAACGHGGWANAASAPASRARRHSTMWLEYSLEWWRTQQMAREQGWTGGRVGSGRPGGLGGAEGAFDHREDGGFVRRGRRLSSVVPTMPWSTGTSGSPG